MSASLTQSLKIKFFLVLIATIIALAVEHTVSISVIKQQQDSIARRDMADHLGLLVDRVYLLSENLHEGLDKDRLRAIVSKLNDRLVELETGYYSLRNGIPQLDLTPPRPETILELFDGPTSHTDQWMSDLVSHVRQHTINYTRSDPSLPETQLPDQVFLQSSVQLITNFFIDEQEKAGSRLNHVLFATQATVLAAIVLITLFVFRPALRNIASSMRSSQETEALSRKIIETAAEGYARIDPVDNTYLEINHSLCEMLGYTREEMIGKTPVDFCDADSVEVFNSQVATASDIDHRRYEITMRHKDGSPVYTQYNASTIRDDVGGVRAAIAFITDISSSRMAMDTLTEERDKAQQATETKDKVVSLIAHDLKNPLGAIRGFSEFMLIDKNNPLTDHLKNSIQTIYEQSDDMLSLISEVMDISRLQTGNFVVDNVFLDAHYLVEKILQRLVPMASAKQVTLVNKLPPGTRIYGDSTLLGQVFQNLLTNAIKFSNASSEVHILLEDPDNTDTTSLAVRDFGIGVPEKANEKLFILEEKTSTDGTSGEKGTGFGLPLSHQIMTAHQGDLIVSSVEGEGSTFTATLKNIIPNVMVIDDDPVFQKIIAQYLSKMEVNITQCGNGEEAWEMLNQDFRPHLIISDIEMPKRNGIDLLVDIRMNVKMSHLPVIMVTGDTDAATRERILKLGANDFVSKPIDPEDFLPRVRQFIV